MRIITRLPEQLPGGCVPPVQAKKEERIKYLTTYDKSADFSEYTLKELDKEVMRRAARKQMDVEKRGESKRK